METELVPGGLYRHYKNKHYRVLGTARHSETLEELVLYEALYENDMGRIWVRPKGMFVGTVETSEGPKPRFELIKRPPSASARLYKIALQVAAILLVLLFLYLEIGPFLNWFGQKN